MLIFKVKLTHSTNNYRLLFRIFDYNYFILKILIIIIVTRKAKFIYFVSFSETLHVQHCHIYQ